MEYRLQIGNQETTKKDVIEITKKLAEENPGKTIKEYLKLKNTNTLILI